jgi:hypothetical protein
VTGGRERQHFESVVPVLTEIEVLKDVTQRLGREAEKMGPEVD